MERYGQLQSEKIAEENAQCRNIISEINNFGINDRQRMLLIYLLSQELESVEQMQELTAHIKELQPDICITNFQIESC